MFHGNDKAYKRDDISHADLTLLATQRGYVGSYALCVPGSTG